jgi:SAM-dependent methyltransferase
MAEWSGGYVTDVEYSVDFRREQSPCYLDLACLLNGITPPDSSDQIRYCDLGCGSGFAVSLLAAANPSIECWGIDFNPAHIAIGRRLQADTGLDNLHLRESAFSDLVKPSSDMPQFDYVVLHGVYTWIGASEREAIVEFLRSHVKPGGVVYNAYNTLPGWAAEQPLQRVLSTYSRFARERSDRAVEKAIGFAKRLRDAGAEPLNLPPVFEKLDGLIAADRQRYLAHEYLNADWNPRYHEDVARELAQAKLEYVGSAQLEENFAQLMLTPEQRELCAELGDPAVAETLKDFFTRRGFRKDVYVRGKRRIPPPELNEILRAIKLNLIPLPDEVRYEFKTPSGKAQFDEKVYRPVFETLSHGPATVGELVDLPPLRGSNATPVELVASLVGTYQALWQLREADEASRRRATRFNAVVTQQALSEARKVFPVAAPTLGTSLQLNQGQAFVYAQIIAGTELSTEAVATAISAEFARRGAHLKTGEGQQVSTPEETLAILRREVEPVLSQSLPRWRRLGVV